MLEYPSIDTIGKTTIEKGSSCWGFVKYDGSNLRFEWSKSKGFHKFGTRTGRFGVDDPDFGGAIELFQDELAAPCIELLRSWDKRALNQSGRAVVFAEYFGPSSFAGTHLKGEAMRLKAFEAHVEGVGYVSPKDWTDLTQGRTGFAQSLGQLSYGADLARQVWEQQWKGPELDHGQKIWEGLILKTGHSGAPRRIKLKTQQWMDAIKGTGDDWEARA